MLRIPSRPEDLTAAWLTEAFHRGGYLTGRRVERVSFELLDPTKAVYGTLVQLHLEYTVGSSELPSTMIAKLPSSNPDAVKRLRLMGGDQTEVYFYQQIRESIGLRIPECYYSAWEETTGRFVILLEDLSGYRYGGAGEDLTDKEMVAVVEALAASHAAWWQQPRLRTMEWLPCLGAVPATPAGQPSAFSVAWPVVVDRIGGRSQEIGALGKRMEREFQQAQERQASPPITLLNQDHRQENLFLAGDDENPIPIFIDWQFLRRGRGPASLASFLAFSLHRDRLEESLVGLYHAKLEGAGVDGYPFQECLQDYWMGMVVRFCAPTTILATIDPDSPQGTSALSALSRFGMDNLERYLDLLSNG